MFSGFQRFHQTILQEAIVLFHKEGVSALSEELLIRKLNVSGATFHELFQDKQELLLQAVEYYLEQEKKQAVAIGAAALNPIEEMMGLLRHGMEQLRHINPAYFTDLISEYPAVWDLYLTHIRMHNAQQIQQLLTRAITDNLMRPDLDIGLMTQLLVGQTKIILDETLFPAEEHPMSEVYKITYLTLIRGMCTEKGLALADAIAMPAAITKKATKPVADPEE